VHKAKIEELQQVHLKDFGVPPQFWLVDSSLLIFLKRIQEEENEEDENAEKKLDKENIPFSRPIEILKGLSSYQTIDEKLKCLVDTARAIIRFTCSFFLSLSHFELKMREGFLAWKGTKSEHNNVKKEFCIFFNLIFSGGDEMLPLMVFVIVQARVPNIYSEICFCEDWIEESFSNQGEKGYVVATIQTALAFICCTGQSNE